MRLIDGDALYERACELEAQALEYVGKIMHDEGKTEEWRKWSAILIERTAFKHDIEDAQTIEPQRKTGKWIDEGFYADGHGAHAFRCSECGGHIIEYDADPFCKWCGADMRGDNE